MKKIETYSNWCYIDRLDGIDLKDGEVLIIQWPDKSSTVDKIIVEESTTRISEQGGYYNAKVSEAYIEKPYRGHNTKIRIVGLLAKRMNDGTV